MLIGIAGGLFRYFLALLDHQRSVMVARAHVHPYLGWLLPVLVGGAGAFLARLLVVKLAPTAEGSGVQRVEAVFSGEVEPASAAVVPVKFVGGLLAMGCGLALGREGPTVQMGASFGDWFSRFLLLHDKSEDRRVVQAASAGAGSGCRLQRAHRRIDLRLRRADQQHHTLAPGFHASRGDGRGMADALDAGQHPQL